MQVSTSPLSSRPARGPWRRVTVSPIPWLQVGDMTTAYVDPPPSDDAATLAGIVFLRYENGAFTDVTADVASGRLPVTLR